MAILAADGVDAAQVDALTAALKAAGAQGIVVGTHLGSLGNGVEATMTFANTASVLFDAVYVPGGAQSVKALARLGDARTFVDEAYKHAKPIAAVAEGVELLTASGIGQVIRHAGAASAAAHTEPEQATTAEVQSLSEVGSVKLANGGGATGLAAYGIIVAKGSDLNAGVAQFISAIAHHRFWGRPDLESISA